MILGCMAVSRPGLFPRTPPPSYYLYVCLGPHSVFQTEARHPSKESIYENDTSTIALVEDIAKYYADLPSVWVLILFSRQKQGTPPNNLNYTTTMALVEDIENIMQMTCLVQQPYSKSCNCGIADGNVLKRSIPSDSCHQ